MNDSRIQKVAVGALISLAVCAVPAVSLAMGEAQGGPKFKGNSRHAGNGSGHKWRKDNCKTPSSVPELDPGSASSALVLVAGGLLVMGSRRRRRA